MDEIVWEDPPGGGVGKPRKWEALLAPLKDRPGDWARLPGKHHSGMASHINSGKPGGVEAGEFEAVSRNVDRVTGQADIYARYIGEPEIKAVG